MKKMISVLLAAVLLVSLAGCAQTQKEDADSQASAAENKTAEKTESTTTAESTAAPESAIETDATAEKEPATSEAESAAESAAEPAPESASEPAPEHSETLVVVFSATGTTLGVAEKIAAITDADLYEITAAEPYTDEDLNYSNSASRSTTEQNDKSARPEIGGDPLDLTGYTTIYIGFPIWWGEEPRIMDTFVESYSFDGITLIPFCTSASSGIGRSGPNMEALAGSGTWLDGKRFSGGVSEDDLRAWIESLQ